MNISISRDGIEIGEWTEEEVKAFYREGRLVDADLYWMPGMSEWLELRKLIRPAPPFPGPIAPLRSPGLSTDSHNIPAEARHPSLPPPLPSSDTIEKYPGIGRVPFFIFYLILVGIYWVVGEQTVRDDGYAPMAIGMGLLFGVITYLRLINIAYSNWVLQLLVSMVPLLGWIVFFNCLFRAPGSGPLLEQQERDKKRKRGAS